jgi:hypothetical protein
VLDEAVDAVDVAALVAALVAADTPAMMNPFYKKLKCVISTN